MDSMNTNSHLRVFAVFAAACLALLPARAAAQSSGRVEFLARVAPTGGQPEPVRQLTFYLLRKSVEEIRAEALQSSPGANLDKFVDGLDLSPELKTWMKKHKSIQLSGEEFIKGLSPEDIVGIPEYFKAYMTHNEAYRGLGFPDSKANAKDRKSDPEKYQAQADEYMAAVRRFIAAHPDSIKGMDLELVALNPYPKWQSIERKQGQLLDSSAYRLAVERYVVARTETDLDGRGAFAAIAPGKYWIGMFGAEAISGDVRLHWDVPVSVRQGETVSVELSNLNAARPADATAQNSDN
jgi:hypothetical protein